MKAFSSAEPSASPRNLFGVSSLAENVMISRAESLACFLSETKTIAYEFVV
jgi:hypothetical protein